MKKHIAEELPARKHAPAAAPAGKGGEEKGGDEKKSPEKRVRQAIYDIRYRARREELPLRSAYSQYMQNSSMSAQEKTMVKQKLFGKGGMQAEDFNIEDAASTSVANALYKVFVEGVEKEQDTIRLTYMEKLETAEHRKYKVRVTGKDGRSYVRYADRQKISELRANPNIESVEMTGYGEPYEGEKKKGEQTARAKAGKDWDGDGKVESPAKEYRGVVHNAIQKRRGGTPDGQDTSSVKEEFIGEVKSEKDDSDKKIDVMKGKNKVTVNPEAPGTSNGGRGMQLAHYDMGGNSLSESQAKFFTMLQEKAVSQNQQQLAAMAIEYLDGNMPDASDAVKQMAKMGRKELKKFAKTKHKGLPEKVEEAVTGGSAPNMPAKVVKAVDELPQKIQQIFGSKKNPQNPQNPQKPVKEETVAQADKKAKKEQEEKDPRSLPTAMNLAKNKMRAMGLKMSYEPEGEMVENLAQMAANVTDALPWNRNTEYTTQGKRRKPGENVHGKQTGRGLNTSTSVMTKGGTDKTTPNLKRQPPLQSTTVNQRKPLVQQNNSFVPEGEQIDEKLRSREERMARMMTDKDRKKQKRDREVRAAADDIIATQRALSKGKKRETNQSSETPEAEVRKLPKGQKVDKLAMKAKEAMKEKFDMEAFKEKLRKSEGAVFHDDPQVKKTSRRKAEGPKGTGDKRERESEGRYRSDTPAGKRYQGD